MIPPPKPPERAAGLSAPAIWRAARRDMFQLFRTGLGDFRMAELRTPFVRSFLAADPALFRRALVEEPGGFPKPASFARAMADLLGGGVFVANGAEWARRRGALDAAFAGGRLRQALPLLLDAAEALAGRLAAGGPGAVEVEIEAATSRFAADAMLRLLAGRELPAEAAAELFARFRAFQRAAPALAPGLLLGPLGRLLPRPGRAEARAIRALIVRLLDGAEAGLAPALRAAPGLSPREAEEEAALLFLAGHETSAAMLAWALWLLAAHPEAQERARAEARAVFAAGPPGLDAFRRAPFLRDALREALRLYPPAPILPRAAARATRLRGRRAGRGAFLFLSLWHLHRSARLWPEPDRFDPGRWAAEAPAHGFLPFGAGPRACPGAGFAMLEGAAALAVLLRRFRFAPLEAPRPFAQLTLRAEAGIRLMAEPIGE